MQKAYLNPTPDQTFEIVGDGPYNFTRVLAHTRELEAAGNVEDACNERYQAFQRLALAGTYLVSTAIRSLRSN